jgi:hypothetical protein
VDLAGPVQEWKDLAPVDDGSNQYLGDLCISLRYVPSSGKLTGRYSTKQNNKYVKKRTKEKEEEMERIWKWFLNW